MLRHLVRQGHKVGRKRVRRLMARMDLTAIYQKPRTSTPHPEHRVYPYLLRDLVIDRPNQVWCTDITYISMRRGFMYLVAVMDWASRRVLSWRVSNNMDTDFCIEALEEAMARHGLPEIFNTDQGGAAQGSACAARGMAAEGANSRARASRACWTRPASGSAWMAGAAGWTTYSSRGFGGP